MRTTYKTFLRGIGRKPLPPYDRLRTEKRPGDFVIGAHGSSGGDGGVRWRTVHNHRRMADAKQPIRCPKHGQPIRGAGWESPGVARFRCYAPGCGHVRTFPIAEMAG